MTNPTQSMKEHLGIPITFNANFNDLLKVAERLRDIAGNETEITPLGLIYWLDEFGDFTIKKDKYSLIVNQIFINMGTDMVSLFPFIEYYQNGYKE